MIFVCMLWRDEKYRFGARYTVEHVTRLRNMLARHAPGSELVCVTDLADRIEGVRIVPLWPEHRKIGGTYPKLKLYSREMADLIGPRFVYLDLDCVICGPLDPLIETDAEFKAVRSWHRVTPYNAGMLLITAGARSKVWESFKAPESLREIALSGMVGNDQAWMSLVLGPNEPTWGPEDGVLNYRRHVQRKPLPEAARVVLFPGDCDPSLAEEPWVREHWR